jgi:hypothetical protein
MTLPSIRYRSVDVSLHSVLDKSVKQSEHMRFHSIDMKNGKHIEYLTTFFLKNNFINALNWLLIFSDENTYARIKI